MTTASYGADWVEQELAAASFGDRRLKQRGFRVLKALADQPQASIPEAHATWADCYAAYRFFNNDKVSHAKILSAHSEATVARMAEHRVVLVVHDSSSLNYPGQHREGLGSVGDSTNRSAKGLIFHTAYAVTPQRVPLGLVDQQVWARQKPGLNNLERLQTEIRQKESGKWLRSLEGVVQQSTNLDGTKLIHVMDREADIFELFSEAEHLNQSFIIRCNHNRKVNKASKASRGDGFRLLEGLGRQAPLATLDIEVGTRGGLDLKREAKVEIRSFTYTLTAPQQKSSIHHRLRHEKLELTAIQVLEIPERGAVESDEELINWILLTNVAITSGDEVLLCVDYYLCRWQIEVFHRTLKTGCRVEACRITTAKALEAFIGLMSIVAWRLHWLSLFSRVMPKAAADKFFSPQEQALLKAFVQKTSPKSRGRRQMALHDCVIALARMGGFLNRKGDGNPGPEVLWRGLSKLRGLVEGLDILSHALETAYV